MVEGCDDFAKIFSINCDLAKVTIDDFRSALKSSTSSCTEEYLTKLSPGDVAKIHDSCLEEIGKLIDDRVQDINERRVCALLRLLYNANAHITEFRSIIPNSALDTLRACLRLPSAKLDALAVLSFWIQPMRLKFGLLQTFDKLIADIAVDAEATGIQSSWHTCIISTLLNLEAFLAHAFGDLAMHEFASLLHVTQAIIVELELSIHPNNMQFIVDLLQRMLFDFSECVHSDLSLELMQHCALIIQYAALQKTYDKQLEDVELMATLRRILEAVVDADTQDFIKRAPSFKKTPERPSNPLPTRRAAVVHNKGVLTLANALCDSASIRSLLKQSVVAAIGNLATRSTALQVEAGKEDGVLLVLNCTAKREYDQPFIVQYAIVALRHMCLDCPQNQAAIAAIEDKPCGIIDREKILKELGLTTTVLPDGKIRIESTHHHTE